METIEYFGHVVHPRRLQIVPHASDDIRRMQALINFKKLRSFLGLCNGFDDSSQKFARLAALLSKKLRKVQPIVFGPLKDEETQ